jgi:CBS domain-containing protein
MVRSVKVLAPDQSIRDAIAFLVRHRISGAPVLDAEQRLIGMLSEMDCLRALAAGAYDGEPFESSRVVSDLMTRRCITVSRSTDVYQMAQLFERHAVRRLPVVEADVLLGQVSRRDVLVCVQEKY